VAKKIDTYDFLKGKNIGHMCNVPFKRSHKYLKFLGREMLPSCHGSQVRGKGKIKGVNENWLPWQPRNMSRLI
jgi:hypothetical protein